MNTHIGDKIFQDTPHRVAKFRENRPTNVEISVVGKKIKHGQNITVFALLSLSRSRATVFFYLITMGDCKMLRRKRIAMYDRKSFGEGSLWPL